MRDRHINKDNSFSLGKSMENRVEMKVLEDGLQELGEGALFESTFWQARIEPQGREFRLLFPLSLVKGI